MVPAGALERVALAGQVQVAQQIRVRPELVREGAIEINWCEIAGEVSGKVCGARRRGERRESAR
jgi:hypothetical protein